MLTIKLARIGKKKKPTFRLIITEKAKDPFGRSLEILGDYNPHSKVANFKEERIKYWLSMGSQTTDTVHNLLVSKGLIEGKKIKGYKLSKKRTAKIDEKKKEEKKEAPKEVKAEAKDEAKPAEEAKEK